MQSLNFKKVFKRNVTIFITCGQSLKIVLLLQYTQHHTLQTVCILTKQLFLKNICYFLEFQQSLNFIF